MVAVVVLAVAAVIGWEGCLDVGSVDYPEAVAKCCRVDRQLYSVHVSCHWQAINLKTPASWAASKMLQPTTSWSESFCLWCCRALDASLRCFESRGEHVGIRNRSWPSMHFGMGWEVVRFDIRLAWCSDESTAQTSDVSSK